MTMLWNDCQGIVFMIFFYALQAPIIKASAIFFALRSDNTQRDIAAAVLRATPMKPDLSDRAIRAINELGKIAGKRNDFIHAIWHYEEDDKPPKPWLGVRKGLADKDAIEACVALTEELQDIFVELHTLRKEIEEEMGDPPMPRAKQPPR